MATVRLAGDIPWHLKSKFGDDIFIFIATPNDKYNDSLLTGESGEYNGVHWYIKLHEEIFVSGGMRCKVTKQTTLGPDTGSFPTEVYAVLSDLARKHRVKIEYEFREDKVVFALKTIRVVLIARDRIDNPKTWAKNARRQLAKILKEV